MARKFRGGIWRLEDIASYFTGITIEGCTGPDCVSNCYRADLELQGELKGDLGGVKPGDLLSKISRKLCRIPFCSVSPNTYSTSPDGEITANYELPYKNKDGDIKVREIDVTINPTDKTFTIEYKTEDFLKGHSYLPFSKCIRKDADRILNGIKSASFWKRISDCFSSSC